MTPRAVSILVAAVALAASGCGGSDTPTDVVLVTHDAFAISPAVKKAFETESGLKLRILKAGDAGEVVTRALLTADSPATVLNGRLERYYRSALVMTFGGGTNEIQRDIIGYLALGLPAAKR